MPDDLRDHYLRALHLLRDMFEQLSVEHVDQAPDPISLQVPRDVLIAWRTRAAALPLEEAGRVWLSELARRDAQTATSPAPSVATPPQEGEDWRARYSALIGRVDEWITEKYGDDARDDLLAGLGVDGWLQVGWPPPVATPAEGDAASDHRGVGPDGLPLLRLALPMSVELVAAIARGVCEELEPLGYTVHIGDGSQLVARPAERNT